MLVRAAPSRAHWPARQQLTAVRYQLVQTASSRALAASSRGRLVLLTAARAPGAGSGGGSEDRPAWREYVRQMDLYGRPSPEAIRAMLDEWYPIEAKMRADGLLPKAPRQAAGAPHTPQQPPRTPLPPPAATWPPAAADTAPAVAEARAAAAEAAAAAAISYASAAAGHEAAAEAAQAAAASQPALAAAQAGGEWMRAAAAWRLAFDALCEARKAQPGLAAVVEAEAAVEAARRFKLQRHSLRG